MVFTKVPLVQPADDNRGILTGAGTDGRVVVVVVVAVGVVVGGRVVAVGAAVVVGGRVVGGVVVGAEHPCGGLQGGCVVGGVVVAGGMVVVVVEVRVPVGGGGVLVGSVRVVWPWQAGQIAGIDDSAVLSMLVGHGTHPAPHGMTR